MPSSGVDVHDRGVRWFTGHHPAATGLLARTPAHAPSDACVGGVHGPSIIQAPANPAAAELYARPPARDV